jgi:hypothetical protein
MKAMPEFWPRPLEAEAGDRHRRLDGVASPSVKCWPTLSSTARVRSIVLPGGSSTWTLSCALVLLGEEAGRHAHEQGRGAGGERDEDEHRRPAARVSRPTTRW